MKKAYKKYDILSTQNYKIQNYLKSGNLTADINTTCKTDKCV